MTKNTQKTKQQLIDELAELRRLEEQYRQLLDQMTDGHCVTRDQHILFANTRLAQILGCHVDQLIGRSWMDFLAPDIANYIEDSPMAELPWPLKVPLRRDDGQPITVEVSAHPTVFNGKIAEFVILRDISEREQMEEALRIGHDLSLALSATASLDKALQLCLDAALAVSKMDSGGIYLVDDRSGDLQLVHHNGLSAAFVASAEFYQADSLQAQLVRAGQPIYTNFETLGSTSAALIQIEGLSAVSIIPIHHQKRVIGCLDIGSHTMDDIPDVARNALETIASQISSAIARLRAEEALRESEERKFRGIVEHSTDGIVLVDQQGRVIEWNPSQERITGLSKAEVLGRQLWQVQHQMLPAEQQSHNTLKRLEAFHRSFLLNDSGQRSDPLWEQKIERSDGTHREVELAVFPIQTDQGVMAGAIARDITRQRQAEQRLRLLSSSVEQSSEGIAVADLEGNLLFVNQAFAALHGYTPEQVIGKHLSIFHSPEHLPAVTVANEQIQATGEFDGEIWHLHRDGTEFLGLMRNSLLSNEAGVPVAMIGTLRDITQRKSTEEALRRRNLELATLNRSIHAFVSTLDLDQVLSVVLEEMRQLIGPYACSAWLIEPATGEMICQQAAGPISDQMRGWRLSPGTGTVGWVARHAQSIILPDAQIDPRFYHAIDRHLGLTSRSVISVPLTATSGVIGVLSAVATEPGRFQESDLVVLESLAAAAALAIQNARMFEQAQHDAQTQAVLLREVNHRVKNNLSTVIGLLYASRRYVDDRELPVHQSIMGDLVNRVQGMATVHDMLSESQWSPLRLSDLSTRIIHSALQGLPPNKHITVRVAPSPARVSAKQAGHLALVINELATNAAKYALHLRDTAHITVWTHQDADTIQFIFQDDGPGFPQAVLNLESHNVGYDLIQNIVRQNLYGTLELENVPSARITIQFQATLQDGE